MSKTDEERRRESKETLERARRDSETLGGSTMARSAIKPGAGNRAQGWADHFAGKDALHDSSALGEDGKPDPTEIWGRRIGRSLSLVGVIVLGYMLGVQLKIW